MMPRTWTLDSWWHGARGDTWQVVARGGMCRTVCGATLVIAVVRYVAIRGSPHQCLSNFSSSLLLTHQNENTRNIWSLFGCEMTFPTICDKYVWCLLNHFFTVMIVSPSLVSCHVVCNMRPCTTPHDTWPRGMHAVTSHLAYCRNSFYRVPPLHCDYWTLVSLSSDESIVLSITTNILPSRRRSSNFTRNPLHGTHKLRYNR